MANREHVELLTGNVAQWNKWREGLPKLQPDLSTADLSGTDLSGANLSSTDLSGANLRMATLNGTNLSGADLSGANLRGTTLSTADLSGVYLSGANLSGVYFSDANLSGADLHGANLSSASVNLNGTNLSGANLSGAHLIETLLIKTNLSGANLSGAHLSGAYLDRTNFSGADLSGTDFSDAYLNGTNFSGAYLTHTIFARVDLRSAKGLIEINHKNRSIVELHSIQLPQDGSALHFLRGVGAPDEWIDFYRASMMLPIQYYSCFISYSNTDEILARRLHADLQASGVRCWFAPEDLKIGNKFRQRIDEAIHLQDKLLLLLSEHAIASTWVEDEVEAALEKEQRQQREVLFPVCLDESVMQTNQAWAATLRRTRHIGDFTNWTDMKAYRVAFERLLRDLKRG